MTCVAATADKIQSGYGVSFSGPIALVILALTTAVRAWAAYPVTWVSDSASPTDFDPSSFDARFISGAPRNSITLNTNFRARNTNILSTNNTDGRPGPHRRSATGHSITTRR
jgi:hypothetical protein